MILHQNSRVSRGYLSASGLRGPLHVSREVNKGFVWNSVSSELTEVKLGLYAVSEHNMTARITCALDRRFALALGDSSSYN